MGIIFANIVAIYRRELQSYFASPLAYVVAGVFWLLAGFFFYVLLLDPTSSLSMQADAQVFQAQQFGAPVPPFDVPAQFLQLFLSVLGSVSLFVLPILSMGLYAEERKRGTLELLATSPVTNWAVAVGKLLGVTTFFATMVVPLLIYEAIALGTTTPPVSIAIVLLGHGGLLLMAMAILSLGMFISSLTDSTILSAVFTFGLVLFLWIIDLVGSNIGGPIGAGLGYLSLLQNYNNLTQGILDTSSLVLFASYIGLGIFLTAQSIDVFRFRN